MGSGTVRDTESSDRRRRRRYRARLRIRFWNDEGFEGSGFTTNVSNMGMFFETASGVEIGSRLHCEVDVQGKSHYAEIIVVRKKNVPARVRSVVKPGIGAQVVPLLEAVRQMRESTDDSEQAAPAQTTREPHSEPEPPPVEEPPPAEQPAAKEPEPQPEPPRPELDLSDIDELERCYRSEIAMGGVLLQAESPPPVDSVVNVRVYLPPPYPRATWKGRVVQHHSQDFYSIKFEVGDVIEDLVEEILARSSEA